MADKTKKSIHVGTHESASLSTKAKFLIECEYDNNFWFIGRRSLYVAVTWLGRMSVLFISNPARNKNTMPKQERALLWVRAYDIRQLWAWRLWRSRTDYWYLHALFQQCFDHRSRSLDTTLSLWLRALCLVHSTMHRKPFTLDYLPFTAGYLLCKPCTILYCVLHHWIHLITRPSIFSHNSKILSCTLRRFSTPTDDKDERPNLQKAAEDAKGVLSKVRMRGTRRRKF